MAQVIEYGWGEGFRVKVDAQRAGKRLAAIHKRRGHLSAELVVAEASKESSPLHEHFEWDNTEAAEQYRLVQARTILRAIVIIRDNGEKDTPLRAFVHLTDSEDEAVYMDINVAMGDAAMRNQVLTRAWRELESWRRRYEEYEELAAVFAAMDTAA